MMIRDRKISTVGGLVDNCIYHHIFLSAIPVRFCEHPIVQSSGHDEYDERHKGREKRGSLRQDKTLSSVWGRLIIYILPYSNSLHDSF
jgi:hypothetical protein